MQSSFSTAVKSCITPYILYYRNSQAFGIFRHAGFISSTARLQFSIRYSASTCGVCLRLQTSYCKAGARCQPGGDGSSRTLNNPGLPCMAAHVRFLSVALFLTCCSPKHPFARRPMKHRTANACRHSALFSLHRLRRSTHNCMRESTLTVQECLSYQQLQAFSKRILSRANEMHVHAAFLAKSCCTI